MRHFVFRTAWREPDGRIGPMLHGEVIEANDTLEAIAAARQIKLDWEVIGANVAYLSDNAGQVVWSFHAKDQLAQESD